MKHIFFLEFCRLIYEITLEFEEMLFSNENYRNGLQCSQWPRLLKAACSNNQLWLLVKKSQLSIAPNGLNQKFTNTHNQCTTTIMRLLSSKERVFHIWFSNNFLFSSF